MIVELSNEDCFQPSPVRDVNSQTKLKSISPANHNSYSWSFWGGKANRNNGIEVNTDNQINLKSSASIPNADKRYAIPSLLPHVSKLEHNKE
eukprot:gene15052-20253_t